MNKYKTLAALVATALLATAGAASAQTVTGGGASLPADLYKGKPDSILPASFSYAVTGSGTGKKAFLENNSALFQATGTVHFAGSDSVLSGTELTTYNTTYNVAGDANRYGALIQVPSVATSVTVPFNKAGGALNLNVTQICGVFSGKITKWEDIAGSGRSGDLVVVYRDESSGTSELLTRFLTTACTKADVEGTTLKQVAWATGETAAPKFAVQSTFKNLFVNNTAPANFIPASATGGSALYSTVQAAVGRIGYVSPDAIPAADNTEAARQAALSDATKVAKVKGYSPNEVDVQATLESAAPPSGADASDPAKWVPVFGNPANGYPIAGYTNLVFGQCYKATAVANSLRGFLMNHYNAGTNGTNDAAVRAHGFIPLTKTWREAIRARFVLAGNAAALNNPSTCANIGRPL
ncbi:substrate-binding domain-containing protein [Stenotrophomonas sp. GD03908]|uniref:Alkaline phosphatase n=1 Tax=Stenotrophomonas maltophilia TaxID=40324 RepID=C8CK35_STEMA|nr:MULTISPECIES: substrate-binding domain-containing protein [Stenotrophomonas]ACV49878.1 alkaline phosphatase [Stenotrophomonas maltophilia]MBH1481317.1 substrate-binding domain-containing protein [Stenotrophomonas maltophilia]MCU1062465.1 substrate-binding domain-containing protein [Stenotrophomonas maltophilia]MDH0978462.1 substrate-binding domain-containing protein [Stenotrophomonas sp. GD03908]MDQ7292717.1 substrate-binding domain-containing protein [Stenotrophomonas sp. Sm0041]